jgi:hypothetical protein
MRSRERLDGIQVSSNPALNECQHSGTVKTGRDSGQQQSRTERVPTLWYGYVWAGFRPAAIPHWTNANTLVRLRLDGIQASSNPALNECWHDWTEFSADFSSSLPVNWISLALFYCFKLNLWPKRFDILRLSVLPNDSETSEIVILATAISLRLLQLHKGRWLTFKNLTRQTVWDVYANVLDRIILALI